MTDDISQQDKDARDEAPERKSSRTSDAYEPPQMIKHGELKKLIRGGPSGDPDDAGFQS